MKSGFQDARFVYFSISNSTDGVSRLVHNLVIDPARSAVNVWAEKYSPIVLNWEEIDLGSISISADGALQIAELHGGRENRESFDDTCYVSVAMLPSSVETYSWQVQYYENPGALFKLQVDAVTGQYE